MATPRPFGFGGSADRSDPRRIRRARPPHRGPRPRHLPAGRSLLAELVLASPYFLLGSVERLVEHPLALRERHSSFYVSFLPGHGEAFAPVVARLTGR